MTWMVGIGLVLLLGAVFFEGIDRMVNDWFGIEENSHCVLLPFISAYLIWQVRDQLKVDAGHGHWSGVLLIVLGLVINLIGKYSSVFALQQYALLITFYGLVISYGGWRMFRKILVPLLLLVLMVPLPNFFLNNLSSQLQLISSRLGVAFIRMTGTSVFLEGNVIDLGTYKLQVVEACSGLRYLFPLITMSAVMAYMMRTTWWKRWLVVISSIPLTIIMNSLRIASVGIMVEHWGPTMAEGFLHEFQGWMVFMLSMGILFAEVIIIAKLEGKRWRNIFGLQSAVTIDQAELIDTKSTAPLSRPTPRWLIASAALLLLAVPAVYAVPQQTEVIPQREYFNSFPLQVGEWQGKRGQLDQVYLEGLKLDDYFIADYFSSAGRPINFYVAWYDSQQAGHSVHSPRSCLPGGGWSIKTIEPISVTNVAGRTLNANRVLMEYGGQRQLVYYWFQQRGHVISSEYMVKWYLFVDALTRHRSDGALVRTVMPISEGASLTDADAQLVSFIRSAASKLTPYIPD